MIGLGLNIKPRIVSSGGSFDAATTAFMTSSGIPNDGTVYFSATPQEITGAEYWTKLNDMILATKEKGLFDPLIYFYPSIGGTASSSKWNLKDPRDLDAAFRLTFYGGLIFDKFGVTGNGTNGYADTHCVPSVDINGDSSFGFRVRNDLADSSYLIGSLINNSAPFPYMYVYPKDTGNCIYTQFENVTLTNGSFSNTNAIGNYRFNQDSGSYKTYKDNTLKQTRTAVPQYPPLSIILFATNTDNVGVGGFSAHNAVNFDMFNRALTPTEVADWNTIINDFETSLNRL